MVEMGIKIRHYPDETWVILDYCDEEGGDIRSMFWILKSRETVKGGIDYAKRWLRWKDNK
jgi:hypothetical protein